MDSGSFEAAGRLVGESYARQAREAGAGLQARVRQLLEQGKLPDQGWTDREVELVLAQLAAMDSNNFPGNCGVGEREGRVYSRLVRNRNYNTGHGVGRSGDLTEVQPKAAGSSLVNKLTNSMLRDVLKISGLTTVKAAKSSSSVTRWRISYVI